MPSPQRSTRKAVRITDEIRNSRPRTSSALSAPLAAAQTTSIESMLDDDRTSACDSVEPSPTQEKQVPFVAPPVGRLRPRMPVVSGYDRLDYSIAALVDRLPPGALEEKFNIIAGWIERFHVDVTPARTERLLASILDAAEQQSEAQDHAVLSHLKVLSGNGALCAKAMSGTFAAHQLLLLLSRLHPALSCTAQRTMEALLQAVYVSPPTALPAVILDSTHDSGELRQYMLPFKGRMHFQANKDAARRLTSLEKFVFSQDSSIARQKRVLQKAVRAWQSSSVRLTLRAWRKVVEDTKLERAIEHERQSHARKVRSLESDLDSAKRRISTLEDQLRNAQSENAKLVTQVEATGTKFDHERHALEKNIASRDFLIEDLEEQLKQQASEWEDTLKAADDKFRRLGNAVAACIHEQEAQTGVGALAAPRRLVVKVLNEGVEFNPAAGANKQVCQWIKRCLAIFDPDESIPRPDSIVPSAQTLDCFSQVAMHLFPHLRDANETLAGGIASISLSQKAKAIVRWAQETSFDIPESLAVSSITQNSREGANTLLCLFQTLMYSVARPFDCFANALEPGTSSAAMKEEVPDDNASALDAEEICTRIRQYVQELRSGGKATIDLLRASWCHSANTLHHLAAGNVEPPLSADEKSDRAAFEINHQLIADVSTRDDVPLLQTVIDESFRMIRRAFLFYAGDTATVSAQNATVAPSDIYRLAVDCRLCEPGVIDRETIAADFAVNALDSRRFTAALIRIARRRFPGQPTVVESLAVLLESHLLAFAEVPDDAQMPKAVADDAAVSGLLNEYRNDMFKIFRAYCKDPENANKLSCDHFLCVMRDGGLIGGDFSEPSALRVFHRTKSSVNSNGMSFDSFLLALQWASAFIQRDPFQRPATKVKRVIFGRFLPSFRSKLKLSFTE